MADILGSVILKLRSSRPLKMLLMLLGMSPMSILGHCAFISAEMAARSGLLSSRLEGGSATSDTVYAGYRQLQKDQVQ